MNSKLHSGQINVLFLLSHIYSQNFQKPQQTTNLEFQGLFIRNFEVTEQFARLVLLNIQQIINMKYSNLSQKSIKPINSKKQSKKLNNSSNLRENKKNINNQKQVFDNNDHLIQLLLNSSTSSISKIQKKKLIVNRSKSKQRVKPTIKVKKAKQINPNLAKSMDSIDLLRDLSLLNCKEVSNYYKQSQIYKKDKKEVLILEDVSIEQQQESQKYQFDSDLLSNQQINYSLLQNEYQKLIKKQQKKLQQNLEESGILLTQVLNTSDIQKKVSEQLLKGQDSLKQKKIKKQSMLHEKFEELIKILNKFISLKENTTNKIVQTNLSVNLSRNSESKKILNNNLFQINEEWQHSEIINKDYKKNGKENQNQNNINLEEFTLNQINKNYLEDNFLKKEKIQLPFEIKKKRFLENEEKKNRAAQKIKRFWKAFQIAKKNKHIDKFQQYRNFIFESNNMEEEKVEQYFNHQQINEIQIKIAKPQDNFNNLLNQLENQSNREMGNDQSQSEQIQYKQENLNLINTILRKQTNSISFLEEQRKKQHGDSIVLQHLQSISAIRSNSKFRQLSDHDYESEIKQQQQSSSIHNIYNVLMKREIWIEEKSKIISNKNWKVKELDLLSKIKQILKDPTCICFDTEYNQKATSTQQSKEQIIKRRTFQNISQLKKGSKKQEMVKDIKFLQKNRTQKNSEEFVNQMNNLHNNSEIVNEQVKDYIKQKEIHNINFKIKNQQMMKQEQLFQFGTLLLANQQKSEQYNNILIEQNKKKINNQFKCMQNFEECYGNKHDTKTNQNSKEISDKILDRLIIEVVNQTLTS